MLCHRQVPLAVQYGEEMFPEVISQSVASDITNVNHLKAFTGRGTVDEAILCARRMSCDRSNSSRYSYWRIFCGQINVKAGTTDGSPVGKVTRPVDVVDSLAVGCWALM